MHEVTRILNAIDQGDPQAAEQLLPLVYAELRQARRTKAIRRRRRDKHCDATALVHEVYVRPKSRKND